MESLEQLKQELIKQRDEITFLGGKVEIAGNNPSPKEITEAIKTITGVDLTPATAGPNDVLVGKTFFAGDKNIKSGMLTKPDMSLASASTSDVLYGKTFYSGSESLKTGTLIKPDMKLATATESDVRNGKKFYSGNDELKTGTLEEIDPAQATANEQDVLAGKTFFAGDSEIKTGTLTKPDMSLADADASDVRLGKKFYAGDEEIKTGELEAIDPTLANATANDVRKNLTFFAGDNEIKTGTLEVANTAEANAKAEDVLAGKTFFAGNAEIKTGTLTKPDMSLADADASDVRLGKKFYAEDEEIKTGALSVPDLNLATATVNDVRKDITFFAGDSELKTGELEVVDPSVATATEGDVAMGKTFFAGDNTLKTGTASTSGGMVSGNVLEGKFFFYDLKTDDTTTYELHMPAGLKNVFPYRLYYYPYSIKVWLDESVETIETYAFYMGKDLTLMNFNELPNIRKLAERAVYDVKNIDMFNLPPTLKTFGLYSLYNCIRHMPDNIDVEIKYDSTYSYAGGNFGCQGSEGKQMNNLIFPSNWDLPVLPESFVRGLKFRNDFVVPDVVTEIGSYFCYAGDFAHITVGKNVKTLNTYSLGGGPRTFASLEYITFLGEEPPAFEKSSMPRKENLTVYVPDNSLSAYKNAFSSIFTNLKFLPMSQKP